MARIPLQIANSNLARPSAPDYSGLSRSPVGQALEGFGADLSAVGARWQAQQEEAEDFEAVQQFNRFKIAATGDLTEIGAKTPVNGMGFHDNALGAFQKREQEFLASVPERLRPKFQALAETERAQFSQQQAAAELEQRNLWYRTGLTQAVERGQEQVYNEPAALEAARQEALREIDASGLPEIEKAEWREKAEQGIAASLATRELEANPTSLLGSLGVAIPEQDASALIGAMVQVESSGRVDAVSGKGAIGLMQVMPETGAEIAGELGDRNFPTNGTITEKQAYLKREDVSLRYGTHYLNKMLQRYGGDIDAALVAYNGGSKRADAWLRANRDDSVIPKESADYYKKVRAGLNIAGALAPPVQPFLKVAAAFLGAHEGRDGGAIAAFIKKSTGINLDPRQTAWCAAYVNAVLGSQGVEGTGRLNARSFLDFGDEVGEPSLGDIVVLSRGDPNGWQGHVGFYAGRGADGKIKILGGNQSQQVSVAEYDESRVLGYRRPPSVKTTADANDRLAKLPGGGPTGGMVVTELDPRFASLPFVERLKLASQARQQVGVLQQQAETQRKAAYTAHNDSINLGILTGEVTSEDQILMDPVLDEGDKAARLTQFRKQKTDLSETDLAVQEFLAGGMTDLNPLDSDQRGKANKVYDVVQKNLTGATDETRAAAQYQFIRQTNVIPDPVIAQLRRGQFSSNPQDFAGAMDEAARINATAPIAFETMPGGENLRRDLTSFQHMINNRGMSSVEAAQRIIERRGEEYQRNESILGPAAEKAVEDLSPSDVTREFATGWFGFGAPGNGVDPTTQNALLAEYREAYREEFIRSGGDENEAKAQSLRHLKKTWGESAISGDRHLMKFPPEQFYPVVNGGHDYLRDDALQTALELIGSSREIAGTESDATATGEAPDPVTPDDIKVMLRPDGATAADIRAGRQPRYRLFYSRKVDGQTIIDQAPGYWGLDASMIEERGRANDDDAFARAQARRVEESDRPSGLDRDEAMDQFLGCYGVPDASQQPLQAPSAPAPLPQMNRPGSREAIQDRLQDQRQELFDAAD